MHISKPISEDSGSKLRSPFAIKWGEKYKTIGWRKKGFPLGTVREGDSDIFTYVPREHKLLFYFDSPGSKVSHISFDNAKDSH